MCFSFYNNFHQQISSYNGLYDTGNFDDTIPLNISGDLRSFSDTSSEDLAFSDTSSTIESFGANKRQREDSDFGIASEQKKYKVDYSNLENLKYICDLHLLSLPNILEKKKVLSEWQFSEYIEQKIEKYEIVNTQSRIDYEKIKKQYNEKNEGIMVSKTDGSIELKNGLLLKTIKKSNLVYFKSVNSDSSQLIDPLLNQAAKVNEFHFRYKQNYYSGGTVRNEGSLLMAFLFSGKNISSTDPFFLGKGGFGTVQKILDITKGQYTALKIANEKKEAITEIINEFKTINSFPSTEGIQSGSEMLLKFQANYVGFSTKLYNKTSIFNGVNSVFEISNKQFANLTIQLFNGLCFLHNNQMIHGDIKPENCFFNITEGENTLVLDAVLGDLAGVKSANELSVQFKSLGVLGTTHTPTYLTISDYDNLYTSFSDQVQNNTTDATTMAFKSWFLNHQKRDIFALGLTVWFMATGKNPYQAINPQGFYTNQYDRNWLENYNELNQEDLIYVKNRLGESLTQTLLLALSENPQQRPSAEEMFNAFSIYEKQLGDESPITEGDLLSGLDVGSVIDDYFNQT